ncbi:Trm112 family protein [Stratiformator vulcanicus]|uniref:Uncharacterized protein n=1 Tax=Stratiformator vulcanicus TaxID=2527980 RepID=A0A517R3L0_9PLAN|nr:hypothetical protein [Stratiformator vulcanicus]QDT38485.1 hypothetical protein Pan189_28790 [Stratiformator vulcanicus]
MAFDFKSVRDILRCPRSQAALLPIEDEQGPALVSTDAESRLRYPIVDGIPVLLADEATALDEETWAALVKAKDEA